MQGKKSTSRDIKVKKAILQNPPIPDAEHCSEIPAFIDPQMANIQQKDHVTFLVSNNVVNQAFT